MIDGIKLLLSKFYQDLQGSVHAAFQHHPFNKSSQRLPAPTARQSVNTEDWWPDRDHMPKSTVWHTDGGTRVHFYFVMENVNLASQGQEMAFLIIGKCHLASYLQVLD